MKSIVLLLVVIGLAVSCNARTPVGHGTKPFSHELWNSLLQKYVDDGGLVDYKGFVRDKAKLEQYLDMVSANPPDTATWTKDEQLAYWFNAYNAFTIKLIVDNYPVKSIQDLQPTVKIPLISTVWKKKFFEIGGEKSSLDEIEHGILRKRFHEPRIHFAINCASYSCPPLRNEAYTADKLDEQLNDQGRRFVNNPKWNKISPGQIDVSPIFSWFSGDFTKHGTLIDFLNRFSKTHINENAKVEYMKYDWSLNEQR